jgi:acyl dehydratase
MNMNAMPLAAGQTLRIRKPAVTTVQLARYAGASGDFNRIHYDHPFAVEKGLPGVIAHGNLTLALTASALQQACRQWTGGDECFIQELSARYLAPVRPGDEVEVTVTIASASADGAATIELAAAVGERAVLSGRALVIASAAAAAVK